MKRTLMVAAAALGLSTSACQSAQQETVTRGVAGGAVGAGIGYIAGDTITGLIVGSTVALLSEIF